MPTLDQIIHEATETYLGNLTPGSKPVKDIKTELSKAVLDQVEVVNAVRPKGHKLHMPSNLTLYQIARIILHTRPIISVACAGEGMDPDYDMLAIYQDSGPDEGLYVTDENAIRRLIREYNHGITMKETEEVCQILKQYAEHRSRNSDRDLIAVNTYT